MGTVTHTELNKHLPLLGVGKVRELYELNASELLFVTTDRISGTQLSQSLSLHYLWNSLAYDIIMRNAITGKGCILTQLSKYWFDMLQQKLPNLKHHLLSVGLPEQVKRMISPDTARALDNRSMVVKRVRVLPIESIVRGYITGSAWSSYQQDGSFCGISLPPGLKESQKLEHPIWTPSTKAEKGGKDENISQEEGQCFYPDPKVSMVWASARWPNWSCQDRRTAMGRADADIVTRYLQYGKHFCSRTWHNHRRHEVWVWRRWISDATFADSYRWVAYPW